MRVARRWIVFGALAAVAAFGAFAPSGGCAAGPALVGEAGADWIAQKADGNPLFIEEISDEPPFSRPGCGTLAHGS